jgi:hypothetical protein
LNNSPGPSRQIPTRPDTAASLARVGEFLYTEEELALIINRAAQRHDGSDRPTKARYTLAEIQEIAAGAGIAPSDVAAVAAGLRENRERSAHRLLGAPWRFRSEDTIDGEVSDDVVGELIDLARRELGLQGRVNEALGTVEWMARDSFGATYVTVTRRSGRTTIGVLSARTDAAALAGVLGVTGAVLGSLGLGIVFVATAGLMAPLAAVVGTVGATGGSWLSTRLTWRRYARRYVERTAALSAALFSAARCAIEEGRVAAKSDSK